MRAVVHDRYGPPEVLRLADVERPVPGRDDVLVRVHATTVNRTDCHRRAADPFVWRFVGGLRRPKRRILGSELAGEVVAVGAAVTGFAVGERVFGYNPWSLGAHAEYVCVAGDGFLAPMPAGASFEEAAPVCDGALGVLSSLRAVDLRKGQRILVYGASGSIGTAAVQLARHLGAHVTAVCDTRNVDTVRSLGPDEIIDRLREDFTANGQTYDVIFDAVAMHSFGRSKESLNPDGIYLAVDNLQNMVLALWTARIGDRKVMFPVPPRFSQQDVVLLKELVEAGRYRAVIDRRYPLESAVEATRYVETKQKTGNVVLTVDG